MMPEKMTQSRMLELLQRGHQEWVALLAEVGRQQMEVPGLAGGWSVKDTVAHVSWFEREMVGMLKARALVGSELWNLPQDERNRQIQQGNKDRPLEDVLGEARYYRGHGATAGPVLWHHPAVLDGTADGL